MVSLVLEASNAYLSIACFENDNLLSECNLECKRNLSEILLLKIDDTIKIAELNKKNLTEIIVANGPGSYTALRVVLAVAKTLSFVLNIPIKTLSTLRLQSVLEDSKDKLVVALIDGRRGNIYASIYYNGVEVLEENYYNINFILDYLNKQNKEVIFVGSDVNNFDYSSLKVNYILKDNHAFAKNYILIKENAILRDYYNAIPKYLRLTEAERNLENDKNK